MMRQLIKRKWAKVSCTWLAVMFLAMGISMNVQAGFGDFNDYGGGDWDSGWDSDYDYDYDYGGWDDYGSDWGDYDYGYDGNDWGSGYGTTYNYGGGYEDVVFTPSFIRISTIVLIIIIYLVIKSKKNSISSGSSYGQTISPQNVKPQWETSQGKQQKTLPNRTDEISKVIQEKDPFFTAPDFISFGKQVYMDIQDAWMKRNLEPVRGVLHQNLYQQTEKQIQKKIEDGIINYLERISINTGYLTSYRRDAQYEYLTMYLAASMIDYQVREATGEVILGNKSTRWDMYYKMTFMRTVGSLTGKAGNEDGMECPNCGAPLLGTSFGVCEYCGSTVTTGVYDWVLSDFGVIKKDTVDEGIVVND